MKEVISGKDKLNNILKSGVKKLSDQVSLE